MRLHRYDPAYDRMRWWERIALRPVYFLVPGLGAFVSMAAGLGLPALVFMAAFCVVFAFRVFVFAGTFYYLFRRRR